MKKKCFKGLMAGIFLLGMVVQAHATVILDFDTLATGSDIINNPLVTADGTITATSTNGSLEFENTTPGTGLAGNWLRFTESTDGGFGQIAFDYDVSSVSFLFTGIFTGVFTGEVLDASFTVVDSFFDSDTEADLPGGPVVLTGSNIRYFRFSDSPGGFRRVGVDSLTITPSPVPEPTTMLLFGFGLFGLAGVSRRKR